MEVNLFIYEIFYIQQKLLFTFSILCFGEIIKMCL